jgi:hypothetical protein
MPGKRKTELLETETAGGQTAEVAKELLETKTAEGERHASCEFETNEVEVEKLEANLTLQAWFPPNRGSATPRFFKGSVLSDYTVHTGFHLIRIELRLSNCCPVHFDCNGLQDEYT